jgi:hypothetical protein
VRAFLKITGIRKAANRLREKRMQVNECYVRLLNPCCFQEVVDNLFGVD